MHLIFKCLLATLFLTILPTKALSDDISFSYGLGLGESAQYSTSETKVIELSYRQTILDAFYWNYEAGIWLDNIGNGRSSSGFLATGPGFLVDLKGFEIRNAYGIAAITNSDIFLGGNFPQFHGELYAGFRDKTGNGIGIKYNHFSSAGVYMPNVGRDFILLELSVRL